MADKTSIEWTRGADGSPGATWNPITGCSVVSPGCTNCYAMKLAGTRLRHIPSRTGLTVETKAGPVWNGQVRLNESNLTEPLRWRRGRRIFVCAHGDLFHESVPDEWIDRVFAVMALAPQHTFKVLTKRAARMRAYIESADRRLEILCVAGHMAPANKSRFEFKWRAEEQGWPLKNVWLGVSAEDQRRADERVPDLLATPAAVRFVSAEPLLGSIRFDRIIHARHGGVDVWDTLTGFQGHHGGGSTGNSRLDWIIVGGESGPGARPMHPAWARQIRDACAEAGVAFHFKQHGAWLHMPERAHFKELAREPWQRVSSDIPEVRPALMFCVGKKAAGRLLDGVEHNGFPEVRHG